MKKAAVCSCCRTITWYPCRERRQHNVKELLIWSKVREGEKKKVQISSSCAYRLIDEYENPLLRVFVGSFTVNFGLCLLPRKDGKELLICQVTSHQV